MVKKKKSITEEFVWKKGDKYRFIIWNPTLEKAFIVLLILTVIVLTILAYTQHKIIISLI